MQLIFGKSNSKAWRGDESYNFVFNTCKILEHSATIRGYIYLNQIYEALGFEWDPKNENVCYYEGIEFETFLFNDGRVLINILG